MIYIGRNDVNFLRKLNETIGAEKLHYLNEYFAGETFKIPLKSNKLSPLLVRLEYALGKEMFKVFLETLRGTCFRIPQKGWDLGLLKLQ